MPTAYGERMPEIPDLEAIRAFLNERIVGREITEAQALIPVVFRVPSADFAATMVGNRFEHITRRGKFLIFALADEHLLVINAMLTGRFHYARPEEKKRAKTCMLLTFDDGRQLRYSDQMLMGKVYVVEIDALASIPQFAEMGPDALEVTVDEFRQRIRKHSGAIKNVLTNHKFVAGIGNAYADEILFQARINPFRRRTTLSDNEITRLHGAVGEVMDWAVPILRTKFSDDLDYEEWREHLKVHRKGGERCPRCGAHITEIAPNQRVTSYCRTCQL